MKKVRAVIQYKGHFEAFLLKQPKKVQDKIFKVIEWFHKKRSKDPK
jgi:hypothetical protein